MNIEFDEINGKNKSTNNQTSEESSKELSKKQLLLEKVRALNQDYTEKVTKALSLIEDKEYKKLTNVKKNAKRLRKCQKKSNLKFEEIAEYLGVTHRMVIYLQELTTTIYEKGENITDEELNNISSQIAENFPLASEKFLEEKVDEAKKALLKSKRGKRRQIEVLRTSIDKEYLEIFSLLYKVSPLYLVGMVNDPSSYTLERNKNGRGLIEPIVFCEEDILNAARTMIFNLYKNEDTRDILWNFLKICDAKHSLKKDIVKHFQERIMYNKLFTEENKPISKIEWNSLTNDRFLLTNCQMVLTEFGQTNPVLFKLMYNLSFHIPLAEKTFIRFEKKGFMTRAKGYKNQIKINHLDDNRVEVLSYDTYLKRWI